MVENDADTRRVVEEFVFSLFRGENSNMAPVLHYIPPSPPCRAVLLLGRMLNINFDLKVVNLMEGEHMKPEYIQVIILFTFNAIMHKIQTLTDG